MNAIKETLPLRTHEKSSSISTAPLPAPNVDFTQLHILIVEDNLVNQRVLSKQLRKLGCTVNVADHGGHALAYLEKTRLWNGNEESGNRLDIILMDLEMVCDLSMLVPICILTIVAGHGRSCLRGEDPRV